MTESEPSIEKLWELSELEAKLALNPTAAGYRELAQRYGGEGWQEDSLRVTQKAAELAAEEAAVAAAAAPASTSTFTGSFNPRVLLELLQVLHLTGKSGELRLAAPGGAAVRIVFSEGLIVGADGADAHPGEPTLVRALGVRGGRYDFAAGEVVHFGAGILGDTAGTLARLAGTLP